MMTLSKLNSFIHIINFVLNKVKYIKLNKNLKSKRNILELYFRYSAIFQSKLLMRINIHKMITKRTCLCFYIAKFEDWNNNQFLYSISQ